MALTRITKGVIKPNENYDTHNINSTGIVTAIGLDVNGNGDISGNLSVGGVLTYEDVTSIDSVGIITAQKDIHVGAGVSVVGIVTAATFKGDGDFVDIDVDGHTELDNLSVAGVSTFASDVNVAENIIHTGDTDTKINFPSAGNIITLHTNGEERVRIGQNGSVGLGTNNPEARVDIYDDNTSIAGLLQLTQKGTGDASINFQLVGVKEWTIGVDNSDDDKFKISSAAALGSASGAADAVVITTAGNVSIAKDFDVDGHTNLDNVSIAGITTVAGNIIGSQTQTFIGADTSDGSDNKSMMLAGGGSSSVSRGAYVWVKGNEYSGSGGELILAGGGVSSSLIDFYTNSGQRARITSTGELNIGGSYTQTTNKLNVTGTAYVSSDITAGDDIIAADEIRNNVPGDFWASDNTFISFNGYGNLTHMGGFETNLTSNGYRDTNGQWVSYAANSNTGAAQIGLQPQGNIIFRTNASKSNGTAHNPTERLKIKSDGNILVGTGGDLEMSSTGRIFVGNGGNETNPMFANISDTNTGIFFPAADNLAITTGGNERLRITGDGEIRIGGNEGGYKTNIIDESNRTTTAETALLLYAKHDGSGTTGAGFGTGIRFWGDRASGNIEQNMGRIMCTADVNSGTTISGALSFETSVAGSLGERLRIKSDGRLLVNTTAVVNTDDFLTIKRPAGNTSVTSMTLDATTSTGSNANALIFTKAKDYYYNGIIFTSSNGHQGGICGKMTAGGGSTPQIDFRIAGSGFNNGDILGMTMHASGQVCIGNNTTVSHSSHTKLEVKSGSQVGSSYGVAYFHVESPSNNPCVVIDNSTGGNTSETHGLLIRNTGAGYGLRVDADGSGGNPFIIDSSGDVRIGRTTDLGGGLDVFDKKLILSKTGSGTRNWAFLNNNIAVGNLGIQVSASTDGTDWANRIEIDANGQVCIGNPAIDPTHRLVLQDSQAGDIDTLFLRNTNVAAQNTTNILFGPSNGVATIRIGGWARDDSSTTAKRDGHFYVETRDSNTFREHFRVSSIGKIIMATNTSQGTTYEDGWNGGHPQNVFNSFINYKHYVAINQYTWYKYTAGAGSSSRPQWVNFKLMWSTGHASGVASWDFSVLTRNAHGTSVAGVQRCILNHQYYHSGSYYGWSSTPNITVYTSTDEGSIAGFYLRVQGHGDHNSGSFNMNLMHSWHILAFDNQWESLDNSKFEFVTNSSGGPSAAASAQSWHSPDTSPP